MEPSSLAGYSLVVFIETPLKKCIAYNAFCRAQVAASLRGYTLFQHMKLLSSAFRSAVSVLRMDLLKIWSIPREIFDDPTSLEQTPPIKFIRVDVKGAVGQIFNGKLDLSPHP